LKKKTTTDTTLPPLSRRMNRALDVICKYLTHEGDTVEFASLCDEANVSIDMLDRARIALVDSGVYECYPVRKGKKLIWMLELTHVLEERVAA
jgi:hypothetical protein